MSAAHHRQRGPRRRTPVRLDRHRPRRGRCRSPPESPTLPSRTWSTRGSTVDMDGTVVPVPARSRSGPGGWWPARAWPSWTGSGARSSAPSCSSGSAALRRVFIGSLIIGLRASAPLEAGPPSPSGVHRRRVPRAAHPAQCHPGRGGAGPQPAPDCEEYRAVLRRIAGESHRLRRIVDDLLWLARIDDERSTRASGAEADVSAIAADIGRAVPADRRGTVELSMQVDVTEEPSRPDPRRRPSWIDRLVGVLVDNACKFAGAGGEGRVVTVRAVRHPGRPPGGRQRTGDPAGPAPAGVRPFPPGDRPTRGDRPGAGHRRLSGPGHRRHLAHRRSPLGGARMEVSWRGTASPGRSPTPARRTDRPDRFPRLTPDRSSGPGGRTSDPGCAPERVRTRPVSLGSSDRTDPAEAGIARSGPREPVGS